MSKRDEVFDLARRVYIELRHRQIERVPKPAQILPHEDTNAAQLPINDLFERMWDKLPEASKAQ